MNENVHPTQHVLAALTAIDELTTFREVSAMLRLATELARTRLGLERVGLFLRDPRAGGMLMRGTWGTGSHGETTDERALQHELEPHDCEALLRTHLAEGLGQYRARSALFSVQAGQSVVIGEGWVMATPIAIGQCLLGVMYNDAALTHSPMDPNKQAAAAVFCALLALLSQSRPIAMSWVLLPPGPALGPLVAHVLRSLEGNLSISGDQLAAEFGVSPGHLARAFKRKMGMSLVEYRNRLRLDRFFALIQSQGSNPNLLCAALDAGFGSYAQFFRVHCRCLGTTPRELLATGGWGPSSESPPVASVGYTHRSPMPPTHATGQTLDELRSIA